MGIVERKARDFRVDEGWFSYEIDSNNFLSFELYEPEYENLSNEDCIRLLEFATSFNNIKTLSINLSDFVIKDSSYFENLVYLETLHIECDTQLFDLNFLSSSSKLKYLYIEKSNISDISILSQLEDLLHITCCNAYIENIDALESLSKLQSINFYNNKIVDIVPIKSMTNLEYFIIGQNNIFDISVFSELSQLKYLDISKNIVENIHPLKNILQLEHLNVSGNKISEISSVEDLVNLKFLNLNNNCIADIRVLHNCDNLQYLYISHNKVEFLQPINGLKNLVYLYVDANPLSDTSEMYFSSQLEHLSMQNCGMKDISFLSNQKKLKYLNLNSNNIQDFLSLIHSDSLVEIYVKNNGLTNSFPVHFFPNISIVDLSGNIFGNKKFLEYLGYQHEKNLGLIVELRKLNADFYFKQSKYDEALAFYYYDLYEKNDETFYIYLNKFLRMPSQEIVYVKYYFSKMNNALFGYFNRLRLIEENYDIIFKKLLTLKEPERAILLDSLRKLDVGDRYVYSFSYFDFYFYQNAIGNPLIEDELLFLSGSFNVKREHLLTNLYYLKELKKRNSPFYFNLFAKIKKVLQMNFAYTDSEREEYNRFDYILHNLEVSEIPQPAENVFESIGVNRQFHYSYYEHPKHESVVTETLKTRDYIERYLLLFLTIAMFFCIVMAIIFFIKLVTN